MGLIICESEFKLEDRNNPGYSMTEIDYYAWIPAKFHKTDGNHRLTLRKNLKTNEYELIKVYNQTQVTPFMCMNELGVMITHTPDKQKSIEICFKHKDLDVILEEGDGLWNHYHSTDDYVREPDKVCQHQYPTRSIICKINSKL